MSVGSVNNVITLHTCQTPKLSCGTSECRNNLTHGEHWRERAPCMQVKESKWTEIYNSAVLWWRHHGGELGLRGSGCMCLILYCMHAWLQSRATPLKVGTTFRWRYETMQLDCNGAIHCYIVTSFFFFLLCFVTKDGCVILGATQKFWTLWCLFFHWGWLEQMLCIAYGRTSEGQMARDLVTEVEKWRFTRVRNALSFPCRKPCSYLFSLHRSAKNVKRHGTPPAGTSNFPGQTHQWDSQILSQFFQACGGAYGRRWIWSICKICWHDYWSYAICIMSCRSKKWTIRMCFMRGVTWSLSLFGKFADIDAQLINCTSLPSTPHLYLHNGKGLEQPCWLRLSHAWKAMLVCYQIRSFRSSQISWCCHCIAAVFRGQLFDCISEEWVDYRLLRSHLNEWLSRCNGQITWILWNSIDSII